VFIVYIKNKEKKIIGLIYKKEKEKDAQIKKIFERFRFKNYSIFNKDKESKNSNNKELITNNKTEEIFDKLMDIIEKQRFEIEMLQKDTLLDRIRLLNAELEKVKFVLWKSNQENKAKKVKKW
jgi:hypothetical protein